MSGGALVLVATPIGNLADLSPRAADELARADVICCEDTRRTGKLLELSGIAAPALRRVDDHTEEAVAAEVVRRVRDGGRIVVVSDAGTPGVSDPGERLVAAAVEAGVEVTVVPGPSAGLAALVASGLSTARFAFEGFLPRKGSARARRLAALAADERTTVLHESPHRLAATLADLAGACGPDRRAVVARELTKLHEEFARGTLAELMAWAEGPVKGEVVVVVEGAPPPEGPSDDDIVDALGAALDGGATTRDAAGDVARRLGVGRRRVYELALGMADR